ncbi:MAG: AAA family ATPase [Magnetococcales bacterium]|nr:AAA family ATPase [Magnetococcales bacterium]
MIEEMHIRNFKCFAEQSLSGLKRVNVIVGPNGSGKSALLEALFLVAGSNPGEAIRIKRIRGLEIGTVRLTKLDYEALWRDMFHSFDQEQAIEISLGNQNGMVRSLRMAYEKNSVVVMLLGSHSKEYDATAITPITFEWRFLGGDPIKVAVELRPPELIFNPPGPPPQFPMSFIDITPASSSEEIASIFSECSKRGQESVIINALKDEYPFLKGLSIEITGGTSTIFASVENLPEKIPISHVSSGIGRLFTILLAIRSRENGIVAIDEIENGFYYDRMPSIWSLIHRFAVQYDVQIFASTHSWECLQAAAACAEQNPADFALVQTPRLGSEYPFAVHPGDMFALAMEQRVEIR